MKKFFVLFMVISLFFVSPAVNASDSYDSGTNSNAQINVGRIINDVHFRSFSMVPPPSPDIDNSSQWYTADPNVPGVVYDPPSINVLPYIIIKGSTHQVFGGINVTKNISELLKEGFQIIKQDQRRMPEDENLLRFFSKLLLDGIKMGATDAVINYEVDGYEISSVHFVYLKK